MPHRRLAPALLTSAIFATTLLVSTAAAQDRPLTLNLATPTLSSTIAPGTYQIRLRNRLPDRNYQLVINREIIPLGSIELPAGAGRYNILKSGTGGETCPNTELASLEKQLEEVQFEGRLAQALERWRRSSPVACHRSGAELFERLTTLVADDPVSIDRNERLRIEVSRSTVGGEPAEWAFVRSTQPQGAWRTTYGFVFAPDRTDRLYSEPVADTTKRFLVQREDKPALNFDFVPSVMFAWTPTRARVEMLSAGLIGGLGYDLTNIAVLVGGHLTYYDNLTITSGLIVHPQQRAGRYGVGDTIGSNLTPEQLTRETLRPNLYFGISLRLGRDPFERAPEPTAAGTTQEPATTPENAAPRANGDPPSDPAAQAGPTPSTLSVGDSVGDFTVASILPDANGDTIVAFREAPKDVVATYTPQGTGAAQIPCITLFVMSLKPPYLRDVEHPICFPQSAIPQFAAFQDGDEIRVSFHALTATASPTDVTYRAALDSVAAPPTEGS